MSIAQSIGLFLLAGLSEIGGGYLVWQRWRNGANWGIGLVGGTCAHPVRNHSDVPTRELASL